MMTWEEHMKKLIIAVLCLFVFFAPAYRLQATPLSANRLEDDFYTTINKEWLDKTTIQSGYTSVSNFTQLTDQTRQNLQKLFEEIVDKEETFNKHATETKMITLYKNYLNQEIRNEQGIEPLRPYLKRIQEATSIEAFKKLLDDEELCWWNPFYYYSVLPNFKDSGYHMVAIGGMNLHLGDAALYGAPTKESERRKEAIQKYLIHLLKLTGYEEEVASMKVKELFSLEEEMAQVMLTQKEIYAHPNLLEALYNPYTKEELEEATPHLKLYTRMKEIGYHKAKCYSIDEPKYIQHLDAYFTQQNLERLKNYMEITMIEQMAPYLDEGFQEASKHLKKELYGVEGTIPLQQEALEFINNVFASEIGKYYSETYFSKEQKKEVEALVDEIIMVYRERLKTIDWLSESTKTAAIKKLDNLGVKVGYPNKWENYKQLTIKSHENQGSLVDNIVTIKGFRAKKEQKKITQKVDRSQFHMWPQTVNACYSPLTNEITFPAALLQPPFYHSQATKEENLGGIGAVIAHEITHAFDHTGGRFDEKGNMKNWWTDEDYKAFEKKAQQVKMFYSKIECLPGQWIDGDLTVGENIADIGAMACVLEVLEKQSHKDYKKLFESWAKIWRIKLTDQYQLQLLLNDPHSPNKYRVNGVLMQFETFHNTYQIKPGDKMYLPEGQRISIW